MIGVDQLGTGSRLLEVTVGLSCGLVARSRKKSNSQQAVLASAMLLCAIALKEKFLLSPRVASANLAICLHVV